MSGKSDLWLTHFCWLEPRPTPQGGQGRVMCLCGFESVSMSIRWCDMFVYMHESGNAALPGARLSA